MPWYFLVLELLSGLLLANGVPHFVKGMCGEPFPSPFAKPPGVGDSSPLTNVVWGFGNLVAGALLLHFFWPRGSAAGTGRVMVALGALIMSVQLSVHFGKVRSGKFQ